MKLMLHIVRKDLLRLRWYLTAWLAVIIAKYAIGYDVVLGGMIPRNAFRWLDTVVGSLGAVEVVATFFLTALLVQGDALVGSRQFWLTRPISGGRLLGAKILGVALLLVLPAMALAVPWWLVAGFDARMMTAAAVELVAWQMLAVVPAFLVASLTDTLGRFLMWSLVLIWLVAMAPFYSAWLWTKSMGGSMGGTNPLTPDRMLLVCLVLAAMGAAVVTLQYLTRNWPRSVIVLVGGCLLGLGAGTFWFGVPSPSKEESGLPSEWNAARAAGVKIEWVVATADKPGSRSFETGLNVRGQLHVSGLPEGLVLTGGAARFAWQWPAGFEFKREGNASGFVGGEPAIRRVYGLANPVQDGETERWLQAHPPKSRRTTTPWDPRANVFAQTRVPVSIVGRTRREPARFRLEAGFVLRQPTPSLEAKLQPGTWSARKGSGLRVTHVRPGAESYDSGRQHAVMLVTTVDSHAELLIDPASWPPRFLNPGESQWWRWYGGRRIAVNRTHGMGGLNYHSRTPAVRISSVSLNSETLAVSVPKVVRDGKWVLERPDWFDRAELAVIDWVPVARFTREVTVEEFKVAPW